MEAAFTKLFNSLDDILLDSPNARDVFQEFVQRAVAGGFLDVTVVEKLEDSDRALNSEPEKIIKIKAKIADIVRDFFPSCSA